MSQDPTVTTQPDAGLESVRLRSLFTEILGAAKSMLPPEAAQRFGRIILSVPEDLPEVQLNVAHARSFLLLLAHAALQNAREGTQVTISAKANLQTIDLNLMITPNPMFVLLTRGTREGIEKTPDAAALKNASDSFISFHAARLLGSTMQVNSWVETIPPDKAVLHAYFPLHGPSIPTPEKQRRVLVIEDNRQISMLLELYLKHEGFETHSAVNGLRGLEVAKELRPDLITLDVMMPEMDGWQALKQLKTAPETRTIPVFVVSVLRDIQIGFEFGASGYLTKPVNRNDLIQAIQRLISSRLVLTIPGKGGYGAVSQFPPDADVQSAIAAATGAQTVTAIDSAMAIMGAVDAPEGYRPDAVFIDARTEPLQAMNAANRVRVYSSYHDLPVIGIADGGTKDFFQQFGAGLFTAVAEKNGLPALFG